jgi:hypothetical protein
VGALRFNTGKAPISYIFELPKAVEALARVFEQGAIKYAASPTPSTWTRPVVTSWST